MRGAGLARLRADASLSCNKLQLWEYCSAFSKPRDGKLIICRSVVRYHAIFNGFWKLPIWNGQRPLCTRKRQTGHYHEEDLDSSAGFSGRLTSYRHYALASSLLLWWAATENPVACRSCIWQPSTGCWQTQMTRMPRPHQHDLPGRVESDARSLSLGPDRPQLILLCNVKSNTSGNVRTVHRLF